jgi:hypothetical protein
MVILWIGCVGFWEMKADCNFRKNLATLQNHKIGHHSNVLVSATEMKPLKWHEKNAQKTPDNFLVTVGDDWLNTQI